MTTKFDPRRRAATFGLLGFAATCALPARAQDTWLSGKPIRLVLPFSAGGAGDITARQIAQAMSLQLKQPVIVDNKPGAGGIIGSDFVAKSPADGYTLLIAGNGFIASALLRPKMPYAETDLVPVASTNNPPSVIVINPSSPIKNLKDLQVYAKTRPGGITFGTAGAGSTGHFVAEMLKSALGVPVTAVHYKSGSETVTAIIGGQIDLASEAPVAVQGYLRSGRLRGLAITNDKRLASLPDVATTAEQGFTTIRMQHWGGIFAPRGTPPAVLDRIAEAWNAGFLADAKLRSEFEANGSYQTGSGTRTEFEEFLRSEKQRLGKIVADSKMTLE
ncbi:Bug family tripartite tricarboxylate transporter substrate binding protein [Polaromonas sp.]|uniref:Bug family tripartite tricarboxylate transporter substrate binding protein n=1 Tax=Polaromonas sp. TaxID=1869339 RepID=UPI003C8C2341